MIYLAEWITFAAIFSSFKRTVSIRCLSIFADPPYFLSNDGITCKGGKMVSVNKEEWDKIGRTSTQISDKPELFMDQYSTK